MAAQLFDPGIPEGWPLQWHWWMTTWINHAPDEEYSWEIIRMIPDGWDCDTRVRLAEQGFRDYQRIVHGTGPTREDVQRQIADWLENNDRVLKRTLRFAASMRDRGIEKRGNYTPRPD